MQKGWEVMKILIVDDEEGVRISLKKVLERDGYEVLQAASGSDAIGVTQQCPEDIETVI